MPVRSGLLSGAGAARGESLILAAFRTHGATGGVSARRLRDLGLSHNDALKRLLSLNIIRRAGPDRFYLDEQVMAGRRDLSGRNVIRVAVVVAIVIAAALIWR